MRLAGEDAPVSAFTALHFLSGAAVSQVLGLKKWLLLHTLFEVWENSKSGIGFYQKEDAYIQDLLARRGINLKWPKYEGDSLANSLVDTAAAAVGWGVGRMR